MLRDTAPEMEIRYQERLGQLSGPERLEVAVQLSSGIRALAEAGLRQRHPGATEEELRCRLVALLYGREVASRIFLRQSRALLDRRYLDEWATALGVGDLLARATGEAGR